MTSAISICNEALAEASCRATITSFDEPDKEAINCKIFYNSCRQELLRRAHWGFARKQQLLTQIGDFLNMTAPYPWGWSYAYPADCIRMRYVIPMQVLTTATGDIIPNEAIAYMPLPMPSRGWRFLIGNDDTRRAVLANIEFAIGVYTCDVTNTDLFDPLFQSALVAYLASKLAFSISGDVDIRDSMLKRAQEAIAEAQAADGNEARPSTNNTPEWIAVRGLPSYAWNAPGGPIGNGWGEWFCGPDSWGM